MGCSQCGHHSATSAHVELAIDNNATWQDAFQFGTPTDTTWTLVGQNFIMSVSLSRYDTVKLLTLTSTGGTIVVDDTAQRVVHLNVSPTTIQADLPPGEYVYDFLMQAQSDGTVVNLMHGTVCVEQGVSAP